MCDRVRQTGYDIHVYHGHGHLEKVYENALAHRLRKLGLEVKQQHPLKVYDEDGTLIGEYAADLLVDTQLLKQWRRRQQGLCPYNAWQGGRFFKHALACARRPRARPLPDTPSASRKPVKVVSNGPTLAEIGRAHV